MSGRRGLRALHVVAVVIFALFVDVTPVGAETCNFKLILVNMPDLRALKIC